MHGVASVLRNRVHEARTAQRLTQRELAAKAGVSHQSIVSLERNNEHHTSSRVMLKLADALGVDFEWLWYAERPAA